MMIKVIRTTADGLNEVYWMRISWDFFKYLNVWNYLAN